MGCGGLQHELRRERRWRAGSAGGQVSRGASFGDGRRVPWDQGRSTDSARSRTPIHPATRAWIEAENRQTFGFLESIPGRAAIKRRLTELWDYEKFEPPSREGGRLFLHLQHGPSEPECPLYECLDRRRGERLDRPQYALDRTERSRSPARRSATTAASLLMESPRLARTGTSGRCATWPRGKTCRTVSGGSSSRKPAWSPDDQGFFYGRFPEPTSGEDLKGANYDQRVYYHRLGTKPGARRARLGRP